MGHRIPKSDSWYRVPGYLAREVELYILQLVGDDVRPGDLVGQDLLRQHHDFSILIMELSSREIV